MQQAPKGFIPSVRCLITFTVGGACSGTLYMENHDKINKAWSTFSTSGKVEDYLNFTMLQNKHISTEENLDADNDRRSDYQSKGYR